MSHTHQISEKNSIKTKTKNDTSYSPSNFFSRHFGVEQIITVNLCPLCLVGCRLTTSIREKSQPIFRAVASYGMLFFLLLHLLWNHEYILRFVCNISVFVFLFGCCCCCCRVLCICVLTFAIATQFIIQLFRFV